MTSRQEIDKMAAQVKDWIVDEGNFPGNTAVQDSDYFRFICKLGNFSIEVFQPKTKEDCVILVMKTNFGPEHKAALLVPKKGAEAFMRFQMKVIDGGCQFKPEVGPSGPEGFLLIDMIYYVGLNKDTFYQRIQRMINCQVGSIMLLNYVLGQPVGPALTAAEEKDKMFG